MSKSMITNQKGFSLIELMVVVAIMGVLAAIGVPQYSKFQAKARQSEAKSSLAAIYTAEQSFIAEFNNYSIDLKNIGFGVTGRGLRYVTGFAATACTGYSTAGGAPSEVVNATNTWSDGSAVNPATAFQAQFAFAPASRTLTGTTSSCISTAGSQAFRAMAIGDPNANVGTAPLDGWTINQQKLVSNSTPGIL